MPGNSSFSLKGELNPLLCLEAALLESLFAFWLALPSPSGGEGSDQMEAEPRPLVQTKDGEGVRLWQCFLGVTYILARKDELGQQVSVTGEASLPA